MGDMRLLILLLTLPLLTACITEEGAANRGFAEGAAGEAYSSIGGSHAALHREAWISGNAQFCRTVSYADLARSLRDLPVGICEFSSSQRNAYCRAVDYAAFGRAEADLPTGCSPSSSQRAAYTGALTETYCTASQGEADLRRSFETVWTYGECALGKNHRDCQRASGLERHTRNYCGTNTAYYQGVERAFEEAQNDAIRDASLELAELSDVSAPTAEQEERRQVLRLYLIWAPGCDISGLDIDC